MHYLELGLPQLPGGLALDLRRDGVLLECVLENPGRFLRNLLVSSLGHRNAAGLESGTNRISFKKMLKLK